MLKYTTAAKIKRHPMIFLELLLIFKLKRDFLVVFTEKSPITSANSQNDTNDNATNKK